MHRLLNLKYVEPTDDLEHLIRKDYTFPIIVKSALSKASKDVYLRRK